MRSLADIDVPWAFLGEPRMLLVSDEALFLLLNLCRPAVYSCADCSLYKGNLAKKGYSAFTILTKSCTLGQRWLSGGVPFFKFSQGYHMACGKPGLTRSTVPGV